MTTLEGCYGCANVADDSFNRSPLHSDSAASCSSLDHLRLIKEPKLPARASGGVGVQQRQVKEGKPAAESSLSRSQAACLESCLSSAGRFRLGGFWLKPRSFSLINSQKTQAARPSSERLAVQQRRSLTLPLLTPSKSASSNGFTLQNR